MVEPGADEQANADARGRIRAEGEGAWITIIAAGHARVSIR
jgi:hypothetical protein